MSDVDADRNLLFGLLALQNGLIDQSQLVAAFHAWSCDKSSPIAAHLARRDDLDPDQRAAVDAMVGLHLKKHGGDVEKSLAAVGAGSSTRVGLTRIGDPDLDGALVTLTVGTTGDAPVDPTRTLTVGPAAPGQRFRVLRPHARGNLGAVFVALDGELNREVALKEIQDRIADDPDSRARFLLEAEVTGGLEHPGIVPVYSLGRYPDGRPYYAMRFIRGDSLKEAIERFHADESLKTDPGRRSLELRKLLRRFIDLCNAIDYAHSRGILHRDIKPGNVMVGRHGETLVVDWGLAKAVGRSEPGTGEHTLAPASENGSAETLPGSAIGTPAYMSPEQADGELDRLGPASDVYSLGATLYSLLTDRPRFEGCDVVAVLAAVRRGDFPPPRAHDPKIDPALEAVCLRALALKPADRYPSARALADDVERWAADEPVSAWHEPFARRARRWARRHRTAVTATAAAVLVALAVQIGDNGRLKRSNEELAAANAQVNRANDALTAANARVNRANADLKAAHDDTTRALIETRAAKKSTEAALAESEESRKQAEAVSSFLVEAFRSPDPSKSGRDVKVVDILDRAAEALDKEFTGTEPTRGAMLDALGRTYKGLGLYRKSEAAHAKALAVRTAALGPDHIDTLASSNYLAVAYRRTGKLAEAVALQEATLRLYASKVGPDHPHRLGCQNDLALAYQAVGRTAEAIKLYEATIKLMESSLGLDHPTTLTSCDNLASAYRAAGRTAEAIKLFESTLKLREVKLGPEHPYTLITRNNLALTYQAVGRTDEAIKLFEAALKSSNSKRGADHPETLTVRTNLANAYRVVGRAADAVVLDEAIYRLKEERLGADHPETLTSRNNLALAYLAAGRAADAVRLDEATVKLYESEYGLDHHNTLVGRTNLANAYRCAGRDADALKLDEGTLKARDEKLGPDHPDTILTRGNIAFAYRTAGRTAEAEPLYRQVWGSRMKTLGPDHAMTIDAEQQLGLCLAMMGHREEAERHYLHSLDAIRKAKDVPAHWEGASIQRIISLYEGWGKPEKVIAFSRDEVARRRETAGLDSPLLANDLASLARNLLKQEQWSDAEPVSRECLAISAKSNPDDWPRFNAMSLLGAAMAGQGRHAEAEAMVVPGYEGLKAQAAKIPAQVRFLHLNEAAGRVVRLYESWGKAEQAAEWKAKLGLADLPDDVFARP